MSIFQPDPLSPPNNVSSTTYRLNLQDTVANRVTEFGTIDPNDYLITQYYNLVNFPKVNNKAKNIRLTLTPDAVRQNKFDFYSGQFDAGYPLNSNKTFCGDKLSTVFNMGNSYWSKSFSTKYSYPIISNYSKVLPNQLNNCNEEPPNCGPGYIYDVNVEGCVPCSGLCLPGQIYDPGSCLCVDPPECIFQIDCPPITIPLIKNTIQGYAFYLDAIRDLSIPGAGNVRASCSGGHVCCRTLFKPKIVKSDTTEVLANRNICMDNSPEICANDGSQIPVPGFTPITDFERSDTFTITLDDPLDIQGASFYLNCEYTSCHDGVTFIVLVAELASSTDKIVIFASCVSPGTINSKLIGTVDCSGEEGLCGDYAYSCYDGVCKNIIDMGGQPGEGLWLNDQYCGGQCELSTPNPYCDSFSVPPTTLERYGNTINVTENITGSVEIYSFPWSQTSCGDITSPLNSKWLGRSGSFSYTLNFSSSINDLIILINSTGHTSNENFIITTNGGIPLIIDQSSCYTTISGNEILSGQGTTVQTRGGGGGIFIISAPSEFTSLTISGSGGQNGSLFAICADQSTTPTPTTPTPTPPPCEDDEGCCLSNYCSMGSGVYTDTIILTNVYEGCGATNYACCNGLFVDITSSTEAGFSQSIPDTIKYDIVITVS